MGLFNVIPTAMASAKLDRGTRPWAMFQALTASGQTPEVALVGTMAHFVRVEADKFGPPEATALFLSACSYASNHPETVITKSGKSVEIIGGWNGYKRPMPAIRAMLSGKPVQDGDGLMLHVVDMVHASKAEAYLAFMALYAHHLKALEGIDPTDMAVPGNTVKSDAGTIVTSKADLN